MMRFSHLAAAAFAALTAMSAAAQTFEQEQAFAQDLVNRKIAELNEELEKEWGVENPVASVSVPIFFPSNDTLPNPFPIQYEAGQSQSKLFFANTPPPNVQPRFLVIQDENQRCTQSWPQSDYAQWSFGYIWQCRKPQGLLWDFYGFAGYSHSMLF